MGDGDDKGPAAARLGGGGDGEWGRAARRYGDDSIAAEITKPRYGPLTGCSIILRGAIDAERLGGAAGQDDRDTTFIEPESAGKLGGVFGCRKAGGPCACVDETATFTP